MKSLIVLFFGIYLVTVTAQVPDQNLAVNIIMKQVGDEMTELMPLLLNDVEYRASSNRKMVQSKINTLVDLFKQVEPHFTGRSDTFKISYDVLFSHIKKAQSVYVINPVLSQNILKEMATICTSCHTQDTKRQTLFTGTSRETFSNNFEYAEFNYLTRNYSEAITYYDRFLNSVSPKTDEKSVLTAFNRELLIFTQIYNNPAKGAEHFNFYKQSKKFSPYTYKHLIEWQAGLHELEASGLVNSKTHIFNDLEQIVVQVMGSSENLTQAVVPTTKKKVAYIWLRGQLYHYLNQARSKNEIPKLLYWLSFIDRATNYNHFYSYADLYLKECMLKYTTHPFAKLCFEEYRDYTVFSFSGSQGTHLPDDIQKEIEQLQNIVYPK